MKKIVAVCLSCLLVMLLCCGCMPLMEKLDDPALREVTQAMLDALIAGDVDAGYALVQDVCTKEEFVPVFSDMQAFLGNTDPYELHLLSFYTNKSVINGQTSTLTSANYEMITEQGKIIVSIQTSGQDHMLQSFYLNPYEKTDYYFTGTLQTMKNATVFQWILLVSNLLAYGFAVFALVDCCRHKMKKKALWILVLILGFLTLGVTFSSTGFRMNFNLLSVTAYSALVRYGSGKIVVRLLVPVGAIVYFLSRRSLLAAPTSPPDEDSLPEEASAEEQNDPQ